jgi:photosystem II stability/assembly factor-like uncharacterized protein
VGGLPTSTVNGFAVDPTNPGTMYVAMRAGIYRSADAGQTWQRADGPKNVAAVAVDPARPADVFAVTVGGVTWQSADGGQTWRPRR